MMSIVQIVKILCEWIEYIKKNKERKAMFDRTAKVMRLL